MRVGSMLPNPNLPFFLVKHLSYEFWKRFAAFETRDTKIMTRTRVNIRSGRYEDIQELFLGAVVIRNYIHLIHLPMSRHIPVFCITFSPQVNLRATGTNATTDVGSYVSHISLDMTSPIVPYQSSFAIYISCPSR